MSIPPPVDLVKMQPNASSTPVLGRPAGRRPIHNLEIESPIQRPDSPDYASEDNITEEDELEEELSDKITTDSIIQGNSEKWDKSVPISLFCTLLLLILAILFGSFAHSVNDISEYSTNNMDISEYSTNNILDISNNYPGQTADFWRSIKVAVDEVSRLNKPQSIVFLYDKSHSVEMLLKDIGEYAACQLRSCGVQPIQLGPNYFKTPEVLSDYGTVIEDNREGLKEKGVMIVHNLEKISGIAAQAFHSLCDEVSPVVGKALFLFSLAMDEVPSEAEKMGYVEKHLKVLWSDIKGDNFQPLVTRMTSYVLPVSGNK